MSHLINHYIENKELIPTILDYGWIVRNDTWTDCPLETQELFKKWHESAHEIDQSLGE